MDTNESLIFSTSNVLGYIDSRWVLSGGTTINEAGQLVIPSGGSASIDATQTLVASTFANCKMVIQYQSSTANSENNFKTKDGPSVKVLEVYKDENNIIFKSRHRCLGLNTFNVLNKENGVYLDTTIYKTLGKPVSKLTVKVCNNSTAVLYIQRVELYTSVDVNEEQLQTSINNVIGSGEPGDFITYTNSDSSKLVAIGVEIKGAAKPLIFKPLYSDGKMTEITTNFGITRYNKYTTDAPDMTNINGG